MCPAAADVNTHLHAFRKHFQTFGLVLGLMPTYAQIASEGCEGYVFEAGHFHL